MELRRLVGRDLARRMTRFAGWPAGLARSVLAATFALVALGLVLSATPPRRDRYFAQDPTTSDTALYEAVVGRLARGEGYYDAVFAEHRERGYPLKPFVTVRLPTLAWVSAGLGPTLTPWLLKCLVVSVLVAGCLRLREGFESPAAQLGAGACAAIGVVVLASPQLVVWHEVWAALLIALSLHCRGREHYAASLLLGIAAAFLRELALPYLVVMAFVAILEHRRAEALAWIVGALLVILGIAAHAMEVSRHVVATDAVSGGWASFGGWRLVLTMIQASTALSWLPFPVTAVTVPLALLGWAAWKSPTGIRGFLLVAGYACGFMIVGRINNAYWGFLLAPILFVGLAFVPAALTDLIRAARGERANGEMTEAATPPRSA